MAKYLSANMGGIVLEAILLIATTVLGMVLIMSPASAQNQRPLHHATRLTFNRPVKLPDGTVLPAGSYWFARDEGAFDNNVVRIFDTGRSLVIATVVTIPTTRSGKNDQTMITLLKGSGEQPDTLLTWFSPGEASGREFTYPERQGPTVASAPIVTVLVQPDQLTDPVPGN